MSVGFYLALSSAEIGSAPSAILDRTKRKKITLSHPVTQRSEDLTYNLRTAGSNPGLPVVSL